MPRVAPGRVTAGTASDSAVEALLGRGRADRERTRVGQRGHRLDEGEREHDEQRQHGSGDGSGRDGTSPWRPCRLRRRAVGRARPAATARAERRAAEASAAPSASRLASARPSARQSTSSRALCSDLLDPRRQRGPEPHEVVLGRGHARGRRPGPPREPTRQASEDDQAGGGVARAASDGGTGARPGPRSTPAGAPGAGGRAAVDVVDDRGEQVAAAGAEAPGHQRDEGVVHLRPAARPAAAAPRRGTPAARRSAGPAGPGRRCARRRSPPSAPAPAGARDARVISQPAVAVRATPDATDSAPSTVARPTPEPPRAASSWHRRRAPAPRCHETWRLGLRTAAETSQDVASRRADGAGVSDACRRPRPRPAGGRPRRRRSVRARSRRVSSSTDSVTASRWAVGSSRNTTGRSATHDPGQGEPGALAGGEAGTVLAERGVQPLRQRGVRRRPRADPFAARCHSPASVAAGSASRRLSAIVPAVSQGRCGDQATAGRASGRGRRRPGHDRRR